MFPATRHELNRMRTNFSKQPLAERVFMVAYFSYGAALFNDKLSQTMIVDYLSAPVSLYLNTGRNPRDNTVINDLANQLLMISVSALSVQLAHLSKSVFDTGHCN